MNILDAIERHVDQQYTKRATWYAEQGEKITREYFLSEDYQGEGGGQFGIAREVGLRVAGVMGEFVSYDVFDNCREHGITYRGAGGWTFCAYEHRNSDQIHIEGCPTPLVESYGPYGGRDKYDTLHHVEWMDYQGAADALIAMLQLTMNASDQGREVTRRELTIAAQLSILS